VRVEAGRLRGRLREYYDTEGKDDPIFIDMPKGGYGVVFQLRDNDASSRKSIQSVSGAQRVDLNGSTPSPAVELPAPKQTGISLPGRVRSSRIPPYVVAALILAVGSGIIWSRWNGRREAASQGASHAAQMRSSMLVSVAGSVQSLAFSPDGKEIAYAWDGENPGRLDVYVQIVGAEKPLRLTHTVTGFTCCVSWSPNGRNIAYTHCGDNEGSIFMVPALGGAPRKLADLVCHTGFADGWPVWSADGKSLFI
jgi:WD40 repeat protein